MHQEISLGGRPQLLLPQPGRLLLCLYAQPLLAVLLPQPRLQGGMNCGGPLLCLLQDCKSCSFCG